MQSARHFCPIVTKFEFSLKVFIKVLKTKIQENPSSGSLTDTCGQTEGLEEDYRRF
jgi:hypothetical protein